MKIEYMLQEISITCLFHLNFSMFIVKILIFISFTTDVISDYCFILISIEKWFKNSLTFIFIDKVPKNNSIIANFKKYLNQVWNLSNI